MNADPAGRLPMRAALIVFLLALAVRVVFVHFVFKNQFYFSDERTYFLQADEVASGRWLGTNTITPPGPLYFIAAGRALGLGIAGLRIVQAVLGAAGAGLTVLLGAVVLGPVVGTLAGLGVAFYPYLAYLSGVFYTQNQVIPLLLFLLFALYRRQAGAGRGWVVGGGAALGLGGIFMVPLFLVAPFVAVWHGLRVRPLRRGFLDVVVLTAVTLLMLVPVTLRNYALDHRFVFVSSMGASSFYGSNNPRIDARSRDADRWIEINKVEVKEEQERMGWTDAQLDSALTARAWSYIRHQPGRALRMYLYRLENMWAFKPHPWTSNAHTGSRQFLVAALTSGPVIVLALVGMLVFLRFFGRLFPLYAVPAVLTLGFSLFNTTVRYRLTFEPLLLIFAAGLVVWVFARGRLGGVLNPAPVRAPSEAPAPAGGVPPPFRPYERKPNEPQG
jgi:hypothetical protein